MEDRDEIRDENGRFIKGYTGNKRGRTPGVSYNDFIVALKSVESKRKLKILEHFINRAFDDDKVLIAVMKKLLADKHYVDTEFSGKIPLILNILNDSKSFPKK